MIELGTFGGISTRTAADDLAGTLLRSPKSLALLVYVAVEGAHRTLTRDQVIGTFWPDTTDTRARQSLNQAVAGLRRLLGHSAIARDGDLGIRTSPSAVFVDVASFDAAYAAGEWAEALAHYRGEFLAGFDGAATPEFEAWVCVKREHYRRQAVGAAEAHAAALLAGGERGEAAQRFAWAADLAPEREDLALAAFGTMADAGDAFTALEWANRYAKRLEDALGVPVSRPFATRVARLREATVAASAGERVEVAAEEEPNGDGRPAEPEVPVMASVAAAATPRTAARAAAPRFASLRSVVIAAGTLALAVPIGARMIGVAAGSADWPAAETTLSVHVEDRTPGVGWPHLALSVEELLAAVLAAPPRLHVTSKTPTPDEPGLMLNGAVFQTTRKVRLDITLSDARTGHVLRRAQITRPATDVLELLDAVADEIGRTLRPLLGAVVETSQARNRTTSLTAWSDLARSKALVAEAQRFAASGVADQAIELLDHADSLARAATVTDPKWLDARLQSAQLARERVALSIASPHREYEQDARLLDAALRELVDDAARWPDVPEVHELSGTIAFEQWLIGGPRAGRDVLLDEAMRSLDRAIALEPYRVAAWVTLSAVHAARRDHAASLASARAALERDVFREHTDEILNRLFHAAFELGDDDQAALWCDEIKGRQPQGVLGVFCELNLRAWTTVRASDPAYADSLIRAMNAAPPLLRSLLPRFRMLQAAVAARAGDMRHAKVLLESAVASAEGVYDRDVAAFHAAALVSLGDFAAARSVLTAAELRAETYPVQRWFRDLPAAPHAAPDPSANTASSYPRQL